MQANAKRRALRANWKPRQNPCKAILAISSPIYGLMERVMSRNSVVPPVPFDESLLAETTAAAVAAKPSEKSSKKDEVEEDSSAWNKVVNMPRKKKTLQQIPIKPGIPPHGFQLLFIAVQLKTSCNSPLPLSALPGLDPGTHWLWPQFVSHSCYLMNERHAATSLDSTPAYNAQPRPMDTLVKPGQSRKRGRGLPDNPERYLDRT